MNKIDICGTKYKVITMYGQDKYMTDNGYIGYCDYNKCKIVIGAKEDKRLAQDTLAHELTHAYLYETGLDHLNNEQDVNIIAKLMINMHKHLL